MSSKQASKQASKRVLCTFHYTTAVILSGALTRCAPEPEATAVESLVLDAGATREATRNAVVRVRTTFWARDAEVASTSECSGTLISPELVLTAAHCVVLSAVLRPQQPTRYIAVNLATGGNSLGVGLGVARCWVHPLAVSSLERPGQYVQSCEERGNTRSIAPDHDIAILRLTRRVGSDLVDEPDSMRVDPIAPIIDGPSGVPFQPRSWDRSEVVAVGFGSELGRSPWLRLAAQAQLVGVATTGPMDEPTSYFELRFGRAGQHLTSGDSGGPSLLRVDGVDRVVGVHSSVARSEAVVVASRDATLGDDRRTPNEPRYVISNGAFLMQVADPARTRDPFALLGTRRPVSTDCEAAPPIDDPDCDGIVTQGNGQDNCPSVANPNQSDIDMDGIGDTCDSCQTVVDPSGVNSNDDSESAHVLPPLGDACDPRMVARTERDNRPFANPTSAFGTNTAFRTRIVGVNNEGGTAEVGYKFCRCDGATDSPLSRRRCAQVAECSLGSRALPAARVFREAHSITEVGTVNSPLRGWAAVNICARSGACASPERDLRLSFSNPFDRSARDVFWNLNADRPRFAPEVATGLSDRLDGVLWTHVPAFNRVNGVDYESEIDRSLRSSYTSGHFVQTLSIVARVIQRNFVFPRVFWRVPEPLCPVCESLFPMPQLAVDDSLIGAHLASADVVFADKITPAAATALRNEQWTWLVSNEPPSRIDTLAPSLVAVPRNGSAMVASSLTIVDGRLATSPNDVPPDDVTPSTRVATSETFESWIRRGAASVYSAARGWRGVYFVGGRDTNEVRVVDPSDGRSRSIALSGSPPPAFVESVAFDFSDESLIVVDRADARALPSRLLRIDLRSGVVEQLGRWRRAGRFVIGVGWNGSLVVARSLGTSLGLTEFVWIDRSKGRLTVLGRAVRLGVLVGSIGVDDIGVSWASRQGSGVRNDGLAWDELRSRTGASPCDFD